MKSWWQNVDKTIEEFHFKENCFVIVILVALLMIQNITTCLDVYFSIPLMLESKIVEW